MQDIISTNLNPTRGTNSKKIMGVAIIIIVAVLVGGIFILRQSKKTRQENNVIGVKEPTPTEKPKIDKKSVKIQVLNGTGTPGQAGTAVGALKKAGYDPDNIKAGNATEFSTRPTTITVRAGFEDIANGVKDTLSSIFDGINIDSAKLDETSEFDVVVVTGGKKFEVTPTPTPTPTEGHTPTATASPTLSPTPNLTPH